MPERNAAYWLDKAQEARARAAEMHDPTAIATKLDIADKYEAMAQQAEGREVRARTTPNKHRPPN